jgi:hypothetical protein
VCEHLMKLWVNMCAPTFSVVTIPIKRLEAVL